jgi:hypothetical protein
MNCRRRSQAALFVFAILAAPCAANAESMVTVGSAQQTFSDFERRYAVAPPAPVALPTSPSHPVQQAAFVGTRTTQLPATAPEPVAVATSQVAPTIVLPSNGALLYPPPTMPGVAVESPASDAWCLPPTAAERTSTWFAATEFIATNSHFGRSEFGPWTDDRVLSIRGILGYEIPTGLGIRARFWGLDQDDCAELEDVDIRASAFDLDLYKRFFIENSELAVGGGGSGRMLEFRQPGIGYSRFQGEGLSMFTEGYMPLVEFPNCEFGQTGRVRLTLLTGDWRDTSPQGPDGIPITGNIVPGTEHDGMTVFEIGWGIEFRRHFGEAADHSWYLALLAEHQRWQSDWMSSFAGSSISFTGLNLSTGLGW